MAWTINYTDTAKKQIRKLDKQQARRIIDYMDSRIMRDQNPRARGKALRGVFGEFWRYRIGNVRVICDIQDDVLNVLVVKLGHRKDIYQ